MEQHTAVKKMMLTVRMEINEITPNNIPVNISEKALEYLKEAIIYPKIRECSHQMYGVGYDAGYQEINQHGNKPITQYRNGRAVNTFKSLTEAARVTGFHEKSIRKCMLRGTPMKQGWTWEYVPVPKKSKTPPLE